MNEICNFPFQPKHLRRQLADVTKTTLPTKALSFLFDQKQKKGKGRHLEEEEGFFFFFLSSDQE